MKFILVVSLFVILLLAVEAVNIRKVYCDNQEYVGNPGGKKPHLHCGKDFLSLKRSSGKHNNLEGACNKVNEILGDPDNYYGTAGDPAAITRVLTKYQEDDCPRLLRLF